MRPSSVVTTVLLILAFLSPSVGWARKAAPPAVPTDSVDQKKWEAKVKAEFAAAKKKLRPRRKSKVETTVRLVKVNQVDVKELVRAIKKMYRKTPGFAIAGLPSVRCVMIRADEKTMEKILRVIDALAATPPMRSHWATVHAQEFAYAL